MDDEIERAILLKTLTPSSWPRSSRLTRPTTPVIVPDSQYCQRAAQADVRHSATAAERSGWSRP